jgi:hypothetical protein
MANGFNVIEERLAQVMSACSVTRDVAWDAFRLYENYYDVDQTIKYLGRSGVSGVVDWVS